MKEIRTIMLLLLFVTGLVSAQTIKVTSGKIEHLQSFQSKYIDARNVDVWLPDGYSTKEKYAVIYMHDGNALFDAEQNWNKQAWEVDEVAGKLIGEGKTQKFIVVGIWNNLKKRHEEYFPKKPFDMLTEAQKTEIFDDLKKRDIEWTTSEPLSDLYLKFIVTELKPHIDKAYSTKTDKSHTFMAGSSMGGLISMYAICEYPNIFGGVACLSTHWIGIFSTENNPVPETFIGYMKKHLPSPKNHKIYFDCGDQELDSLYPPIQAKVDEVMKSSGYTEHNWLTKLYEGQNHSEKAWASRLDVPFVFLLGR